MKKQRILITGAAGFIGFSLCKEFLKHKNYSVIGLDNLNSYYSIKLKKARIRELKRTKNFQFYKYDLLEKNKLFKLFKKKKFDIIFNFAAQAGVRYSYENPESYCNSNIVGFNNLLNLIKKLKKKISYSTVLKSIIKRDKSDYNRRISPLKKTKDSILINTSNLTKRACFLKIKKIIDRKIKN